MYQALSSAWRQYREWSRFKALDETTRAIVFYAEDSASYSHFAKMIDHLTLSLSRTVCYLTSAEDDPILQTDNPLIRSFWIGSGTVRTLAFAGLQTDVCVMTMPSLESFQIKRSRAAAVHYVYVFHSPVSTHMIYLKDAFDNFDTVFCAGPHHKEEIQAAEETYNLRHKNLLEVGYGHLDCLLEAAGEKGPEPSRQHPRRILVAPSWGPTGLLESRPAPLVRGLLDAGYEVTVRPHPVTTRRNPAVVDHLQREFGADRRFQLETNIATNDSFCAADLMISDWSGAALEFAFATERPVLFVDVPRKVNNPDYEQILCTPLEVRIREQIGVVVLPDDLDGLIAAIAVLCDEAHSFKEQIRLARQQYVYNLRDSGRIAGDAIARIADEQRKTAAA